MRANFNGAGFPMEGIPQPYGGTPCDEHFDPAVRESFERDGIRNPVFLWARWGKLWVRLGGSRVMHGRRHGLELDALVADYDDRFPDWLELSADDPPPMVTPPIGLRPEHFSWRWDGTDLDLSTPLYRSVIKSG